MERSKPAQRPAWAALSFTTFADATPEHPRGQMNFWNPIVAQDYETNCATGEKYACELVAYISETGDAPILTRIIATMPHGDDMGGVEVGFLTGLASAVVG